MSSNGSGSRAEEVTESEGGEVSASVVNEEAPLLADPDVETSYGVGSSAVVTVGAHLRQWANGLVAFAARPVNRLFGWDREAEGTNNSSEDAEDKTPQTPPAPPASTPATRARARSQGEQSLQTARDGVGFFSPSGNTAVSTATMSPVPVVSQTGPGVVSPPLVPTLQPENQSVVVSAARCLLRDLGEEESGDRRQPGGVTVALATQEVVDSHQGLEPLVPGDEAEGGDSTAAIALQVAEGVETGASERERQSSDILRGPLRTPNVGPAPDPQSLSESGAEQPLLRGINIDVHADTPEAPKQSWLRTGLRVAGKVLAGGLSALSALNGYTSWSKLALFWKNSVGWDIGVLGVIGGIISTGVFTAFNYDNGLKFWREFECKDRKSRCILALAMVSSISSAIFVMEMKDVLPADYSWVVDLAAGCNWLFNVFCNYNAMHNFRLDWLYSCKGFVALVSGVMGRSGSTWYAVESVIELDLPEVLRVVLSVGVAGSAIPPSLLFSGSVAAYLNREKNQFERSAPVLSRCQVILNGLRFAAVALAVSIAAVGLAFVLPSVSSTWWAAISTARRCAAYLFPVCGVVAGVAAFTTWIGSADRLSTCSAVINSDDSDRTPLLGNDGENPSCGGAWIGSTSLAAVSTHDGWGGETLFDPRGQSPTLRTCRTQATANVEYLGAM